MIDHRRLFPLVALAALWLGTTRPTLNNEMGDFNAAPGLTDARGLIGTAPNLTRPEQRMLSSMTPSILAKDGDLVAVVGSPGGRAIITRCSR